MSKFAFCTDIHLDHLKSEDELIAFCKSLIKTDPQAILITGDISNGKSLIYHLSVIEKITQKPVYFICGNHDFFSESIEKLRKQIREVTNISTHLKYLSDKDMSYVNLTNDTALVGHDGWYDMMHGNTSTIRFLMNDWMYISEYAGTMWKHDNSWKLDKVKIVDISRKLAHEGALHIRNGIKAATKFYKNIVVMTHVPPFEQASLYMGRPSELDARPMFTSKIMGDMLFDASKTYPEINFTVLCGHTHDPFNDMITPNMRCIVGKADYGHPRYEILDIK